jgi:uncharacterized protein YjiK
MHCRKLFLCFVVWIVFPGINLAQINLSYFKKVSLQIPEPSDICLSFNGQSLFIVSDQGAIFETDLSGKIIRSRKTGFDDCEAVAIRGSMEVVVVEERNRRIKLLSSKDFSDKANISIPFKGKANSGFEAITSNSKNWFLFSEKNPASIFTLNNELKEIKQELLHVPGDISGATWHEGQLWLISDEMSAIYIMDKGLTSIAKTFTINVKNAEGIAFIDSGTIVVVSDKEESLYFFKSPLLDSSGN